jgi:hypothetical protein
MHGRPTKTHDDSGCCVQRLECELASCQTCINCQRSTYLSDEHKCIIPAQFLDDSDADIKTKENCKPCYDLSVRLADDPSRIGITASYQESERSAKHRRPAI